MTGKLVFFLARKPGFGRDHLLRSLAGVWPELVGPAIVQAGRCAVLAVPHRMDYPNGTVDSTSQWPLSAQVVIILP